MVIWTSQVCRQIWLPGEILRAVFASIKLFSFFFLSFLFFFSDGAGGDGLCSLRGHSDAGWGCSGVPSRQGPSQSPLQEGVGRMFGGGWRGGVWGGTWAGNPRLCGTDAGGPESVVCRFCYTSCVTLGKSQASSGAPASTSVKWEPRALPSFLTGSHRLDSSPAGRPQFCVRIPPTITPIIMQKLRIAQEKTGINCYLWTCLGSMSIDKNLGKLQEIVRDREACSPWGHKESDMT